MVHTLYVGHKLSRYGGVLYVYVRDIAQLREHLTSNQRVTGLTPVVLIRGGNRLRSRLTLINGGYMIILCAYCGKRAEKTPSAINCALKHKRPLYCGRACAGLARRKNKTDQQKREEKAQYDKQYRANNQEKIKANKKAYSQRTYDPVKAAEKRKLTMARHVEYCRQPEYKKKKRAYDRIYRSKKYYGEFWEAHLLLLEIDETVTDQSDWTTIRQEQGVLNKKQTRRREYERTHSKELKSCPLGNLKRG